ncbi:MAG: T9SS type A sorting domain-containing protein, partial [candidate division Zixibacteria bacterium]|nr:T9SS type A sorting domain-containing protein [candidate division Zixibacteria bacterium]
DTLFAVDAVINDIVYYGALDLEDGSITVQQQSSPPGGCPMLYTWDGSGYMLENTILTHSQGKISPEPADDFYPLKFGVAEQTGFYPIEIREYEKETTFLDQVELIVVDHPRDSKAGISNRGDVFVTEQTIGPLSAVDRWGRNLMPYIGKLDEIWMDVDYPGSMILTYPNPNFDRGKGYPSERAFALGGTPPDPGPKKLVTVETTGGWGDNLFAEIEDVDGNWHYLGGIPPREFRTENSRWHFDPSQAQLGETFRVRITWKTTYKADLQALYVGNDGDYTEYRLSPYSAVHSSAGKIPAELISTDADVVTIAPGEKVALKFAVPESAPPDGFTRKFFLKSHGYYKTLKSTDLIPDRYALGDNYPNPFNPSTTIQLSIPTAGPISLTVFNLLGQEVRTLYDGPIEAGNHEVVWNGDNEAGKPIASGVYFYRLRADGFEQSKKMILLK